MAEQTPEQLAKHEALHALNEAMADADAVAKRRDAGLIITSDWLSILTLAAEVRRLTTALQEIATLTNEDTGTFRKRGGTYRGLISVIVDAATQPGAPTP